MKFDTYILRQINSKDAVEYFSLVQKNKDRLMLYFPSTLNSTKSILSTISYIRACRRRMKKKEFFTYLICDTINNNIIGAVFIKDIDWNIPKSELGFFIDEAYEGKGIVTKSVSLIIDYCFEELKLNKLIIRSAEDNFSSRKVAEKNKFTLEGIIRKDIRTYDGNVIDIAYYGLLRKAVS